MKNIEIDSHIVDQVKECVLFTKSDMFFYNFIKRLVHFEYEVSNLPVTNTKDVLTKFISFSKFLLYKHCFLVLEDSVEPAIRKEYFTTTENEISVLKDSIEYFYVLKTNLFTQFRENDDYKYTDTYFFQSCMFYSYQIALNRFEKNLSSSNVFCIEEMKTNKNTALIISLTPYGIINRNKLIEMRETDSQTLVNFYYTCLAELGIFKINDEELFEKLNTKKLLSFDNRIWGHQALIFIDSKYLTERSRRLPLDSILSIVSSQVYYDLMEVTECLE